MTTLIPHPDPELNGCYQDTGETVYLSDWLTCRGLRVTHTAAMHDGGHMVHTEYPITAGITLMNFINEALYSDGIPFCASLTNEDGLSLTVYPEPYHGSTIRPNGRDAMQWLAGESEVAL